MTNSEAIELAKNWIIGNKFRKKSLIKKYKLEKVLQRNGKVESDAEFELRRNPSDVIPGLDVDESLVFLTGHPPIVMKPKDIWETPKAPKKPKTVPAKNIEKGSKRTTARTRREAYVQTIFPDAGLPLIESFAETCAFDINSDSINNIRSQFIQYINTIEEKTEFRIVAINKNEKRFVTDWVDDDQNLKNKLIDLNNDEEWMSVSIEKRLANNNDISNEKEINLKKED
jgi:hypothetical protein